jgi:hypothetical protein
MKLKVLLAAAVVASPVALVAGTAGSAAAATAYYVSPSGSDSAAGTQAAPFKSIAKAQSAAASGDTVYVRAGTYSYTTATTGCSSQTAVVDAITLSKNGVSYLNYPAEKVQFNFSGMTGVNCRIKGFDVTGSNIRLQGFEITTA